MLELDGSDGGGQVVRTALSLAALDSRPFRMENVRGNRAASGLKRQHLACVDLLAELVDAEVSGAEVGSETLTFEPGDSAPVGASRSVPVEPDRSNSDIAIGEASNPADVEVDLGIDIGIDVGTAGSVTLVADVLLPLATRIPTPLRATLGGGTDVKWSPPTDYLRSVKLPLLRERGLDAAVTVNRRGFYPTGGGTLAVDISPSALAPIELGSRRDGMRDTTEWNWSIYAVASEALEDASVADRLAESAAASLFEERVAGDAETHVAYVDSASPGAVVTLVADGRGSAARQGDAQRARPRAGFSAVGERGVPSEEVAAEAVAAAVDWAETDAPVDAHLGDQLVLWLALVGGRVRIPRVTDHVRTNVEVVRAFGYDVSITQESDGSEATLSAPSG
ncbi:RNA 3'-terminal phosphate cyclase [Halobellus captivus]|uniref:RNA 3'-terminal phosphate cyclase n=1 Tax=Halobellus captivus TaxID=2592614 RepID=UPI0011A8689D|nr:RNA 3'-terminal phosphate cyclase [Halobellus captivus]